MARMRDDLFDFPMDGQPRDSAKLSMPPPPAMKPLARQPTQKLPAPSKGAPVQVINLDPTQSQAVGFYFPRTDPQLGPDPRTDLYGLPRYFDSDGYCEDGFNAQGYDRRGYDRLGFNARNFDRDSYNPIGFNSKGYSKMGQFIEQLPAKTVNYILERARRNQFNCKLEMPVHPIVPEKFLKFHDQKWSRDAKIMRKLNRPEHIERSSNLYVAYDWPADAYTRVVNGLTKHRLGLTPTQRPTQTPFETAPSRRGHTINKTYARKPPNSKPKTTMDFINLTSQEIPKTKKPTPEQAASAMKKAADGPAEF